MRAFVTGAKGFVGSHLVPRLEQRGFEVVATDRELDVADAVRLESALRRATPELVVHLAALSSVAASWRDPEQTYRVNFLGTRAVLEGVARAAPRARLLLIGSADQYDNLCQAMARATGMRVVSAAYRLAPEHPWPAQKLDCLAAARWVMDESDLPVVIGGESAGAHLAAVTAIGLRGAGLGDRVKGLVLYYGVFDLRGTPQDAIHVHLGEHYVVSHGVKRWGQRAVALPPRRVVPWTGNLHGR